MSGSSSSSSSFSSSSSSSSSSVRATAILPESETRALVATLYKTLPPSAQSLLHPTDVYVKLGSIGIDPFQATKYYTESDCLRLLRRHNLIPPLPIVMGKEDRDDDDDVHTATSNVDLVPRATRKFYESVSRPNAAFRTTGSRSSSPPMPARPYSRSPSPPPSSALSSSSSYRRRSVSPSSSESSSHRARQAPLAPRRGADVTDSGGAGSGLGGIASLLDRLAATEERIARMNRQLDAHRSSNMDGTEHKNPHEPMLDRHMVEAIASDIHVLLEERDRMKRDIQWSTGKLACIVRRKERTHAQMERERAVGPITAQTWRSNKREFAAKFRELKARCDALRVDISPETMDSLDDKGHTDCTRGETKTLPHQHDRHFRQEKRAEQEEDNKGVVKQEHGREQETTIRHSRSVFAVPSAASSSALRTKGGERGDRGERREN